MNCGRVRRGDRIRARYDVEIPVLTLFSVRYTGGDRAVLPKDTVLVTHDAAPGADGVTGYPENYDAVEPILAPDDVLRDPTYRAYYVSLPFTQIAEDFDQLPPLDPRPTSDRLPRDRAG
jgi:hypothetical protein